jgi:phage-related baseplate assembly protein
MQKLKLVVEELRVDGFATVAADAPSEGTVLANEATLRCTTLCTEIGSCGHICP